MKFSHTIIYVRDVEATIDFYIKAFNLSENFIHESKQYGELNTGDTKLAFASVLLAKDNDIKFVQSDLNHEAPNFEIVLMTESVD